MNFVIQDQHLQYLRVQRGGLSEIENDNDFRDAYNTSIEQDFETMLPFLPKESPYTMLDVGGGLSGISARICRHYEGRLIVGVLDGQNTLAVVDTHHEPFNNAIATQGFLHANGVKRQLFYSPKDELDTTFGLVISTQAWCFHFSPETYLSRILKCLRGGARVIVDVRNRHIDWLGTLANALGPATRLKEATKWTRWGFVYAAEGATIA